MPPSFPVPNPSLPSTGGSTASSDQQIFDSASDAIQIGNVRPQLLGNWQNLSLAGAFGDWTFFILDTESRQQNGRLERVRQLEAAGFKIDKLMMYYIEVPLD